MSNFLKKALGLFVEFEPNASSHEVEGDSLSQKFPPGNIGQPAVAMSEADIDRFEQHFAALFERSNLPGPDYFEFWKMMETLEAHVPDERTRMAAVFATLSVQGLDKPRLLETAAQYKTIVEQDRAEFERAAGEKAQQEIEGRRQQLTELESRVAQHAETIKRLTEEITAAQLQMGEVKEEIAGQEQKIADSRKGYTIACNAMISKIETDLQKIQASL